MFWIMMLILSALAIIAGFIQYKLNFWSGGRPILITVGVATFLISAFLAIGQSYYEEDIITEYKVLSAYTENYNYTNEAEKVSITNRKNSFNAKLIDNKIDIKSSSFFWINPKRIEQLKFLP